MRNLLLILASAQLLIASAVGATNYVRQAATGSQTGADWNNAYTNLPSTLVRGDVYLVAGGTYPSKTFNTAVSGTTEILVQHAGTNNYGTSTGWSDAFGTNAIFGPLTFNTAFFTIDGVHGGGPGQWTNGFGIRITGLLTGYDYLTQYGANGSNITFRRVAIGNDEWPTPGCDVAAYSANGADNVSFSYCNFFNIGDVGFTLLNVDNWTWEYSRFDRIDRTGEQTVCGTLGNNNHGAGWEMSGTDCKNITIRNNLITNIEGTGWIGIYSTAGVSNVLIHGNIFANTSDFAGTWGNGVFYNVSGATGAISYFRAFNNSFANLNTATIIGLTADIGGSRENSASISNQFFNNIIWNVSGTAGYDGMQLRTHNAGDDSISGDSNFQTLSGDPFTDSANLDFTLISATTAGVSFTINTDMNGLTRGSDGTWDRGAIELSGSGYTPTIVTNNASGARVSGFRNLAMAVLPPPASPYLLEQDFEGTGYDRGQTWNENASGTMNEDYTATVLAGSQSLLIDLTANIVDSVSPTFSMPSGGGDIWYIYFQLQVETFPTSSNYRIINLTNICDLSISSTSNLVVKPWVGTGVSTVGMLEAGVKYHIWLQGSGNGVETGSAGTARVGFSTTGIKPTSGDNYAIDTDATAAAPAAGGQIILGTRQSVPANYKVILDKLRVSSQVIGDNPQ